MDKRRGGNALMWLLLFAGSLFVFAMLVILPFGGYAPVSPDPDPVTPTPANAEMKTFASCDALAETIVTAQATSGTYWGRAGDVVALGVPIATPEASSTVSNDFTSTNVQVLGVDEADILKTDGEYLYLLTRGVVRIIDISPVEDARIVAEFTPQGQNAQDFYIYEDRLVVFGNTYLTLDRPDMDPGITPRPPSIGPVTVPSGVAGITAIEDSAFWLGYRTQMSVVDIFDISDRENPIRERTFQFEGNLLTSRRIDGAVYVVLQSWPQIYPLLKESTVDGELFLPRFREVPGSVVVPQTAEGLGPIVGCASVDYISPIIQANYLSIIRIPINGGELNKRVVLGAGSTVFASLDRLYVAGVDWTGGVGILEAPPQVEPQEQTVVHGFSIGESIEYLGNARVPGHPLNQFSLDEHNGVFRIATTENRWGSNDGVNASVNALYLLDAQSLKRLGQIENIAPGESIFSVRYLGDRAYMVTFKKVDPLFVFDLSDPENPIILGKLKIPGFSDYLHPFNAEGTMIIGVGKNAEEAAEGDFAWYQGMKLALFDARDPQNPIELHKIDIGDRGTDSPALRNHKAFLYDPTRNLLVLPITLAEIPDEIRDGDEPTGSEYGSFTYQGAFLYELTEEAGFTPLGRVTHLEDPNEYFVRTGFYPGYSSLFVERATRVGDILWTISNGAVLGTDLTRDPLATVASIRFASEEPEPVFFIE